MLALQYLFVLCTEPIRYAANGFVGRHCIFVRKRLLMICWG